MTTGVFGTSSNLVPWTVTEWVATVAMASKTDNPSITYPKTA